jgi:hypothetical protein
MPSTSIYRKATEALTKQRIAIVESTEDVNKIEQEIGGGLAEELINSAQDELSLAQKMVLWKPWESLEEAAPEVRLYRMYVGTMLIVRSASGRTLIRGSKMSSVRKTINISTL